MDWKKHLFSESRRHSKSKKDGQPNLQPLAMHTPKSCLGVWTSHCEAMWLHTGMSLIQKACRCCCPCPCHCPCRCPLPMQADYAVADKCARNVRSSARQHRSNTAMVLDKNKSEENQKWVHIWWVDQALGICACSLRCFRNTLFQKKNRSTPVRTPPGYV